MRPRLGVITIGQSPRPDLHAVFAREAPHAEVLVRGALDDLDASAIAALVMPSCDYPLLVRLRDGGSAELPLSTIHARVVAVAQVLAADGVYALVVACAGDFPEVPCVVPVLLPGRILPAVVRAMVRSPHIGVVSPIVGQLAAAEAKWRADGFDPVMACASPVIEHEIDAAADTMRRAAPELVVLDCMGHGDEYTRRFADLCRRPVISAQSLTARVAGALLPAT
jgi:protein AroM